MRAGVAWLCAALMAAPATAGAQPSPDPDPPDPWFGPDKALHFSAGAAIGVGGYALGAAALDSRWAGVALGIGLAAALGGLKEGIDAAGAGDPSVEDWVWDVVGGALGVGLSLSFDAALRGPDPD